MEKKPLLQVFSADDVRKALPMKAAVEAMKRAFAELSAGKACVPARTHVDFPESNGDALVMPSYSPALKRMGVKVVCMHPDNLGKGLPFIQALVALLDAETGTPLAVMNGTVMTAIRTGAASGAATDLLARPDAATVAVFGAGAQAETQLEAVCAVRPIQQVRVLDVSEERMTAFASKMATQLEVEITPVATSAEALASADIVCTATTSPTPVFADTELAPGVHINAIGSYKPHVREVPPETVVRACVVVDQLEAAWEEAGDLIMPLNDKLIEASHIHAELGEIVSGNKPGRTSADQITFFKSVGVATQDLAAAQVVMDQGMAMGLGTSVAF